MKSMWNVHCLNAYGTRLLSLLLLVCLLLAGCGGGTGKETESTVNGTPAVSDTGSIESTAASTVTSEPPVNYPPTHLSHAEFEGRVAVHGRTFHAENGYPVEWPYAGFSLRGWFSGTIQMYYEEAEGYLEETVLSVTVDGETTQIRISKNDSKLKVADVEPGYHEITVRKGTEITGFRFVLTGISYAGRAETPAENDTLKLEVIGDSITNGAYAVIKDLNEYRYLGGANCFSAYSGMLAESLNAEMNVIAISGWGISKGSLSADDRIPQIYGLTSPYAGKAVAWDAASYQPDAVIVALGTNDHGGDAIALEEGAKAFLLRLREQYPNAEILWIYGMMGTSRRDAILRAVNAMDDDGIRYLELEEDHSGRAGHPCEEAQQAYAERLKGVIEDLTR